MEKGEISSDPELHPEAREEPGTSNTLRSDSQSGPKKASSKGFVPVPEVEDDTFFGDDGEDSE